MMDKELRERIADYFAHQSYTTLKESRGTVGEFVYYKQADQILLIVVEEFKTVIRGKYPQGNTYSDQMERVINFLFEVESDIEL